MFHSLLSHSFRPPTNITTHTPTNTPTMPKPAILVLAPPSSLTTSLLHLLTSDSSSFSGRLILASSPAPSVNTSLANVPNLRPTTFDWRDVETWWGLFEKYGDQGSGGTAIGAVYIVPPPVGEGTSNPAEVVEDFVVLARKRGVRRFVLLSSEGEEEWRSQSRGMGSVQRYLKKLEGPGGVEWAVLRAQFLQRACGLMSSPVPFVYGGNAGKANVLNRKLHR